MTDQIENSLRQIQEKLTLLAKQNATLVKENKSLKDLLSQSTEASRLASKNAEALQHQLDARKFGLAMMTEEEKKSFEKKINGYIKEIEKCMALLSV